MTEKSTPVLIRKMSLKDYNTIVKLWKEGNIPYRPFGRDSRKNIKWQLRQKTCFYFVAEIDKKIVGAIIGTHDGRKGWINRLVVDTAHRKQGISKLLVEKVEDQLSRIGINIVACLIEDWNKTSKHVFEKLGYTKHTDILYYSKRKNMKI